MKYEYTVVASVSLQALCDTITRMLNEGWQLQGEVRQVVFTQYKDGEINHGFTQPMLKMISERGDYDAGPR